MKWWISSLRQCTGSRHADEVVDLTAGSLAGEEGSSSTTGLVLNLPTRLELGQLNLAEGKGVSWHAVAT